LASSSSDSPSGSASSPEYAGFWSRFLAFLIDSLIILVVVVPLLIAVHSKQEWQALAEFLISSSTGAIDLQQASAANRSFSSPADFLVQIALPLVALFLFWKFRSATPGKMAIGAKIVDARTGRAPSSGTLILRFFGYFASIPFFLGFFWIAFDKRKQGFHDKIAHTVVVYEQD
jgi:uncharacterized RDD family membrane protein YckC